MSCERTTGARGYALLEMLIAAAVGAALMGVLFQFAVSAHATAAVQGNMSDLQQRLRVAAESLRRDLLLAGAGPSRGASAGPLGRVFPSIVPARLGTAGADPELTFHDDRISILYVPDTRAETTLAAAMVDAGSPLAIDSNAPGCPPTSACDFAAGDRAVIFEPGAAGGAHDVFTIAAVDPAWGTLTAAAPLTRPYAAGARIAAVVQRVYYLDRVAKRLMVYDGARSDVPLVDHVVDLRFSYLADPRPDAVPPPAGGAPGCAYAGSPPAPLLANLGGTGPKPLLESQLVDGPFCGEAPDRFDADLLRVRRVTVTIRLEAESPELRGTGPAFSSPGFSRTSTKYLPDLQMAISVAPRNVAGSW